MLLYNVVYMSRFVHLPYLVLLFSEKTSKSRHAPPPDAIVRLKYKEAMTMGVRYQEHLRRCADAVAFDQNSLCT